jgi:hypothetical protein
MTLPGVVRLWYVFGCRYYQSESAPKNAFHFVKATNYAAMVENLLSDCAAAT